MPRVTLGTTNINWAGELWPQNWRSDAGRANTNLNLCGWAKYNISISATNPKVIGTSTGNTNYGIGTYAYNRGYNWYLRFQNTSNGNINVAWPSEGTYPDGGNSYTSSSSGIIMNYYQSISASTSYWTVTSNQNSGYNFTGWYTATSGGSQITSSTSYNAYYSNSWVYNYRTWYARRAASGVPTSPSRTLYYSPSSQSQACSTFNTEIVYMTPTNASTIASSTKIYSNSPGSTFSNSGWYVQAGVVRQWNQGQQQWTGSPSFCGKCFIEGSKVLMGDGSLKSIENIKTGDKVKTKEGKTVSVEDTFIYNVQSIKKMYSKDNLTVTDSHPVFIKGEWATADKLGWDSKLMFVDKLYNLKTENNFIIEGIAASGTTHEYLDVITDSNGYNKILGNKQVVNK